MLVSVMMMGFNINTTQYFLLPFPVFVSHFFKHCYTVIYPFVAIKLNSSCFLQFILTGSIIVLAASKQKVCLVSLNFTFYFLYLNEVDGFE